MQKLRFLVKPNARNNEIGKNEDGTLWIRIAAPPTEGKANQAIAIFLSELLKIPKSSIQLSSGSTGKLKTFEIDISEKELQSFLLNIVV
jgi:uncharacterized protein (TIGR00251 family)